MNLLTIADALAARYAPGVVTPPTGLKNITAATARPPNNIPNTPFVIAWPQEGTITTGSVVKGEHTFQVVFYYSKAEADIPREYVALMSWLGVLLSQLYAQMQLGVVGVMKAQVMKWEIGALIYGGTTYEGITLTVNVWTQENVTLTPMSSIGVDVRGIPEVQAALGKLEGPAAKKVLQLATKEGGKILKKAVQAEAPRRTGKLRKSISARTVRRDRPGTVIAPRPKVAFYRHMVIGGTKPHQIRFPNQKAAGVPKSQGNISHPGAKANPFISRGFDRGQAAAMAAVEVVDDYLESL